MQRESLTIYSSGTVRMLARFVCASEWQPTLNLPALDIITDILRTSSIDLAADAECSAQNLLNTSFQLLRQRLEFHGPRDLNDLVKRN